MSPLDKFGEFLVLNLRDKAIAHNEKLLRGEWKGPAIQSLQRRLTESSDEQKELVAEVVADLIDRAMHNLLFAIQDSHDRELGVEILVGSENAAERSGMLHGEHLGEGGWIDRFSKYPPSITTAD